MGPWAADDEGMMEGRKMIEGGVDLAAAELRAMMTAWSALSRRWSLSHSEIAVLLPCGGADAPNPPRDTETRMRIMVEIGYRIGYPEDELQVWLRTPIRALGWLTPLDVMSGGLGDLRGFRRMVESGFRR